MNIVNKRLLNVLSKSIISQNGKKARNLTANTQLGNLNMIAKSFMFVKNNIFGFSQINNPKDSLFEQVQNEQQKTSNLNQFIKNPKTIEILKNKGINSLFSIQIQTFKYVYQGGDILASDRTGSGKTIAYSLPIIQKFRDQKIFKSGKHEAKFLVMCPTRQLALQVYKQISSLKHNQRDFNVVAVYGGASMDNQIRDLRNGVDIIVATPGRLIDLLEKKVVSFSQLQATCIDQADQMLEKGFKLEIQDIYQKINQQRKQKTQNLMFSATIPDWVDKISREYLNKDKKRINLIKNNEIQTSKTVQHYAIECRYSDRLQAIKNLITVYNPQGLSTIVFSQTKAQVVQLAHEFGKDASFLQGDMSQRQRQYNLNAFRKGITKILIATDVASRGLDIDNVGLVIQLEPPRNTQPFIHRSGRTGRAGKKGVSITLFDAKKNLQDMLRIQQDSNIKFIHAPKPVVQESEDVWLKKLSKIPHQIKKMDKKVIQNDKINYLVDSLIASHEDVRELLKKKLILLAGQPPKANSLITGNSGYRTFLLENKNEDKKVNILGGLNFLKKAFENAKHTQTQSQSIMFDVSQQKLQEFQNIIKSDIVENSSYSIRSAKSSDRQMPPLSELRKFSRNPRIFQDRDQLPERLQLFLPNIPSDIEQEELGQILQESQIQIKSLKLKRKPEGNAFAFLECRDPKDYNYLLKNGLTIGRKVVKLYKSEPRDSSSSNNSGNDRSNNQHNNNNRFNGRRQYEPRENRDYGKFSKKYNDYE